MLQKEIEKFISEIDKQTIDKYKTYWETITPKSQKDYYNRWIFAYLSVHTTWRKNVESYNLLSTNKWTEDKIQLSDLIVKSGVGLHNMRTKGIWQFTNDFWSNPDFWYKQENETWINFRDRLMNKAYGLGLAKTAFALELSYPKDCGVVCVDTHIIQLYGANAQKLTERKYKLIEAHWLRCCKKYAIPSPIARHIYWDKKQDQQDTTYWSYVFENEKRTENQTNKIGTSGECSYEDTILGRVHIRTEQPECIVA